MMDMNQVIQPKSDQINADDLIAGPMTVTIEAVNIDPRSEQPISISMAGMKKVFRPCKSMARVMVQAWGADASKYAGRSMTLYRDPKVKWGGLEVGGIRISHMTGLDAPLTMMLTQTQKQRAPYKVQPLQIQQQQPAHVEPENALAICEAAARKGTEYLRGWWNSDEYKTVRDTAMTNKTHLGAIAALADSTASPPATTEEEGPPM
jgi:hypothetical protein